MLLLLVWNTFPSKLESPIKISSAVVLRFRHWFVKSQAVTIDRRDSWAHHGSGLFSYSSQKRLQPARETFTYKMKRKLKHFFTSWKLLYEILLHINIIVITKHIAKPNICPLHVKNNKTTNSQWESRKVRTSPCAAWAPISLAVIRPFLSFWRRTRTIRSLCTYSSSGVFKRSEDINTKLELREGKC